MNAAMALRLNKAAFRIKKRRSSGSLKRPNEIAEDIRLQILEGEDQAGIRELPLVSAVVALDIEYGFVPSIDCSTVKFFLAQSGERH